jgi:NTE family protein
MALAVHKYKELNSPGPFFKKDIGLCFSGGGMRAIAFQFGCLKALKKHALLERIKVISAVSGGSILAAMYVYSNSPFEELEKRVHRLLRKGLAVSLFKRMFFSSRAVASLATLLVSISTAFLADALRVILTFGIRHTRNASYNHTPEFIFKIRPPFRRWSSRTTALEDVLRKMLFGSTVISAPRCNNTEVVFNACDLHTGTVFRFGSKKSGCDKFKDIVNNNILVSHAVAASAAHPVFFPAVDTAYDFLDTEGVVSRQKVLLSDGGILDNLGISCLRAERRLDEEYNTYDVDYVICCTAGQGEKKSIPYWLIPRIIRTSEAINRKLLDFEYENLKRNTALGALKGFILARFSNGNSCSEKIKNYPTNFFGLKEPDIDLIVRSGEETTEKYLQQYLPEL